MSTQGFVENIGQKKTLWVDRLWYADVQNEI